MKIKAAKKSARDEGQGDIQRSGGNAAAMRKALSKLIAYWDWNGYDAMRESQLKDMASAALAAPPRNCDEGTAEEQKNRFIRFCGGCPNCKHCPLRNANSKCVFVWAQMPYTEGGAK